MGWLRFLEAYDSSDREEEGRGVAIWCGRVCIGQSPTEREVVGILLGFSLPQNPLSKHFSNSECMV